MRTMRGTALNGVVLFTLGGMLDGGVRDRVRRREGYVG